MILAFNALIMLIVMPVLNWIFEEALRSAGMVTLDIQTIRLGPSLVLTGVLLLVLMLVAAWVVAIQLALVTLALRQIQETGAIHLRALAAPLKDAWKRLWKPSSYALLAYLLILLPLLGAGFISVLELGIAIPPFITGELMKTPALALIIRALHLIALYVALRLSLAVAVFVRTSESGWDAMKTSWRLTAGWNWLIVLGGVLLISVQMFAATVVGAALLLVPTALSDRFTPGASATVAGLTAGVGEVLVVFGAAAATALLVALLLVLTEKFAGTTVPDLATKTPERHRKTGWTLVGLSTVAAVVLGITWVPVMQAMNEHPTTLVTSHRGFVDSGVENTIEALEAAKAVGTDLVEMDVMQTKDGKFIVMHDPNLERLSGQDVNVKDLTQEEPTAMTVHDEHGHEGAIPSLEEYVTKAQELDLPLLMEIKMGGLDSDDHVELFVAEMERLGALENNIYHTLDADSAKKLKAMRPGLTVGYIMPVAGEGAPETTADFIVIEEESASTDFQQDVSGAGLGFFVWTVNEMEPQREYLERHIDAMITDHPDWALASRETIGDERGMTGVLLDTLRSFVGN